MQSKLDDTDFLFIYMHQLLHSKGPINAREIPSQNTVSSPSEDRKHSLVCAKVAKLSAILLYVLKINWQTNT